MQYILLFLEGIITFLSPCLLPMLPIYVSYFAGAGDTRKNRTLVNALGFVLGFTLVFVALGAFAGTIGKLLVQYKTAFDIVTGAIVVVFGLSYLGVLKLPFLHGSGASARTENMRFFSAVLFGLVFSIGWTPCVGAFLGSALMMASMQGSTVQGILMLLCYSLGLGVPFVASALLIGKLKSTFDFIKRHYAVINTVSGVLLIVVGIMMMTGTMGYLLSLLTF